MNYLYQYLEGHQPHFVVAQSYADAEEEIKREHGFATSIAQIRCLGPYVLISRKVAESLEPAR